MCECVCACVLCVVYLRACLCVYVRVGSYVCVCVRARARTFSYLRPRVGARSPAKARATRPIVPDSPAEGRQVKCRGGISLSVYRTRTTVYRTRTTVYRTRTTVYRTRTTVYRTRTTVYRTRTAQPRDAKRRSRRHFCGPLEPVTITARAVYRARLQGPGLQTLLGAPGRRGRRRRAVVARRDGLKISASKSQRQNPSSETASRARIFSRSGGQPRPAAVAGQPTPDATARTPDTNKPQALP